MKRNICCTTANVDNHHASANDDIIWVVMSGLEHRCFGFRQELKPALKAYTICDLCNHLG